MAARFFVDEDDLRLGRALAELHEGVVYPGHPTSRRFPARRQVAETTAAMIASALVGRPRTPQPVRLFIHGG